MFYLLLGTTVLDMVMQQILGICLGYEDLNDHDSLRLDDLYKISLSKSKDLASSATLCRLQKMIDRDTIISFNKLLVDNFINSFGNNIPKELILDIDWTDITLYGDQEGRFYHGYYRDYCYLPLQVTCGEKLLVNYLRTSDGDSFKHSWAIIGLLIKKFKNTFPDTKIIIRADSGFYRPEFISWLELYGAKYIIGFRKNNILTSTVTDELSVVKSLYESQDNQDKKTVSDFKTFMYQAESWNKSRKIISKIEENHHGENLRFLVTNIDDGRSGEELYRDLYCKRGEAENHIKEVQLDLFGDRMSSSSFWQNQFRLMLSSFAYVMMEHLRSKCLQHTKLAKSTFNSIRLKLLKLPALIKKHKSCIRIEFAGNYQYKDLFKRLVPRLFPT